ncbi:phage major tail protein, TP901-1 family [Streptococcus infantis]|uniref:phage major tail protein, TP901-1 family n=1 Tax=Streptococcus infantis TaxID=68892 RepID=UPI001CBC4288|nr:phage major tail protein, TP901-1 family [Streptococcus infantis]MBZ2109888.1 phage major tail protein, TP901-1 family [Streptococcus infantis]MBZ2111736.1 phage major tail protein, TP901-1 family [Streptococcus infantis]
MSEAEDKAKIKITIAKPVVGKKVFYFIQSIHAEKGTGAMLPAYRKDGSTTMGGEYIDEQTQQGRLLEKATDEHSIELAQYFAPKDPSVQVILDAQKTGESVKIWRVIVDESVKDTSTGKDTYPAQFGYGKITDDIEFDDAIDGFTELTYTVGIVGRLRNGKFPLSTEEINMLNEVYDYQNPGETTGDYNNITR